MTNEKRKENERISNDKNRHYFDDTQLIRNFNLTFSNGIWIDNSINFSGTISAINNNSNSNSNNFSNLAEISSLNLHHNNGNNQLNNNDYTIIISGEENIPLLKGK